MQGYPHGLHHRSMSAHKYHATKPRVSDKHIADGVPRVLIRLQPCDCCILAYGNQQVK